MSVRNIALAAAWTLLLWTGGCAVRLTEAVPARQLKAAEVEGPLFRNVAENVGIRFVHDNGASAGRFEFVESTPAGCGFVDYDNDGWLDIIMVQSGAVPGIRQRRERQYCALYHNNRDGTFTDVTAGSGLDRDLGYAQGVAVGDFDNDGYDDLFITAYGGNHLLHNEHGSGHFTDVTHAMRLDTVHSTGYATSAAWCDYDRDGRLDLYVCYYTPWTPKTDRHCRDVLGRRDYCSPEIYDPDTHQLWHNDGDRFTDVTQRSGIASAKGRGLAVAFIDYDEDGWPDIFVANDLTPNMLWHNNRNGTFTNVALKAGCAESEDGNNMAAMGIAVADYDHIGHESLFVTNFSGMPNTIFRNTGKGLFEDVSLPAGVALPHMKFLSFGCEFLDYDSDGWPDLIVADGHVEVHADVNTDGVSYAERKQLYHNEQNGTFREVDDPVQLGDLTTPRVSRGLAVGDYDNDGRPDILVNNQHGPAELFRNTCSNKNHRIVFKLIGTRSNKDAVLARCRIKSGSLTQTATVRGGSSYLSTSDRRLYFGLGSATTVEQAVIIWPSGKRTELRNLAADSLYVITEGIGVSDRVPLSGK